MKQKTLLQNHRVIQLRRDWLSLVEPAAQSRRSPVRSDQAAQSFFQASLKSLQGSTELAQPLWSMSTTLLSSRGKMLLIPRLNLSYLNLLPLSLIHPIHTAVKSPAPSCQCSANADHPIASQIDFLAGLRLIRNLFDSPWPFKDDRQWPCFTPFSQHHWCCSVRPVELYEWRFLM